MTRAFRRIIGLGSSCGTGNRDASTRADQTAGGAPSVARPVGRHRVAVDRPGHGRGGGLVARNPGAGPAVPEPATPPAGSRPPLAPAAAVGLLALGIASLGMDGGRRRVALIGAAVAIGLGAFELIQLATGIDTGLDRAVLLFQPRPAPGFR